MKKILLFISLCLCVASFGQNCNIELMVDDFTGERSATTMDYENRSVFLDKYIRKNKSDYYLGINSSSSTFFDSLEGAYIIFTDGTKWSKPSAKINVSAGINYDFDYSAFVKLSVKDVLTLSNKTIKKYKVGIFEENMDLDKAENLKERIRCVYKMK
ncbi:hypothetical protein ACT4R9_10025 [Ornithobacterium rhinotracheale]|uniref:hypothetical protein n=1 Tax=Ornithobacterium rhinotracheale TaxID=28251 RepID=UPI001FF4595C|nr:hypothetical protein [Ornithobacterium rhinotracheale]MCK0203336.1 hypothetical protein [Ornithobacterium rhinotracheale]